MKFSNINYNIDSKDKNQPLDITSFELSVKNAPSKFTKYIIEDSYNNRKEILKVAKNSAGVYIFLTSNGGLYVGSSVELYARVVSYFKPSSVSNADRHVLHHLRKHGFDNLTLILLVMEPGATTIEVRDLEQYYVSTLCPNLNELAIVIKSGIIPKSSKPVFIYDTETKRFVFESYSILYLVNNLKITAATIRNCVNSGNLFLDRFIFTYEPLVEGYIKDFNSIEDLAKLFYRERSLYRIRTFGDLFSEVQPKKRTIFAENLLEPHLNKEYTSATKAAAAFNCSPNTILNYLKDSYSGKLYLNKWKFTEIK